MKTLFNLFILITATLPIFAQKSNKNDYPQKKFFGCIYTGAFYDVNHIIKPYTGFDLSTALFGYYSDISPRVKVKLIYDVTRTTNNIRVYDTQNRPLNVLYFEGSRYTAFLKQAEIDWKFANNYELDAGQILNQQYLTVQDKFWGYRFVAVTMQEMYRMGAPADFGIRLSRYFNKKHSISIGAINGDGPFRIQDKNSSVQFFMNAEYKPSNFIIKWFADYLTIQRAIHNSFFTGYKKNRNRIGLEYSRIDTVSFSNYYSEAVSIFGSYAIKKSIDIFIRDDFLNKLPKYGITNEHKFYVGVNYHEATFNTSLNFRFFTKDKSSIIYWQFGVMF